MVAGDGDFQWQQQIACEDDNKESQRIACEDDSREDDCYETRVTSLGVSSVGLVSS